MKLRTYSTLTQTTNFSTLANSPAERSGSIPAIHETSRPLLNTSVSYSNAKAHTSPALKRLHSEQVGLMKKQQEDSR